jgi:hypothetical protein
MILKKDIKFALLSEHIFGHLKVSFHGLGSHSAIGWTWVSAEKSKKQNKSSL